MKDYIQLAFAKQNIDIKDLELCQEYDLKNLQLYLFYSKDKNPSDKKLYLVSISIPTNNIRIFQARAEQFNEFRLTDLKKTDKLIGTLLALGDESCNLNIIDKEMVKLPKTYAWWLDISTRIIKAFYLTDKLELMDSYFEHKKYTFVFKNGFERYIAQAVENSNVVLLFNKGGILLQ